ncbi:MAG: hypothetical protein UHM56_06140, partial [Phascolarctobacterium sp.]|nr:hypothetical protein [Phascolarctobacterium sp.]
MHKEVARNAPALHAGPLRFLPRRKKLGKKGFTIWSLRGVIITMVCYIMIQEIEQLANLKRTLRILANEWLVQWFQGF